MTTIITKNSSTASAAPVAGDLTKGELAVNVTDKKLYTKDNGGSVVKLVGSLGNQEASAVAITGGAIDGTPIGGTTASTASFTTVSASGNVTLSGGTANGVLYLNGSKVATSGSALTFDGNVLNATSSIQINSANYVGAPSFGVRYNASNARIGFGIGNANGFPYIGYNTNNKNGSDTPTYDLAQAATQLRMDGGQFIFNYAGSGAAGADISWSEGMRLTSTGLGIGTSSPGYKLGISGVATTYAASASIALYDTVSGVAASRNWLIGNVAAGNYGELNFAVSSAAGGVPTNSKMTLDSSGNLGLGVTPSAWGTSGSARAFELNATAVLSYSTFQGHFTTNNYWNGTNWIYKNNYAALRYLQDASAGSHQWLTAPSGTAGNAITFTQAMTLDASGNLLVGTTSFSFSSNGTQVGADGRIWNTANTDYNLELAGSSNARVRFYTSAGGSGTTVGSITVSTTTTAYNTTSDQRLKENIQDADSASALIDSLQVRKFDWKADGSHQRYGFVAQELVTVAPEAVHQPADPEEMMAVDYSKLVPMLVKEIQSLRARVAQLESN